MRLRIVFLLVGIILLIIFIMTSNLCKKGQYWCENLNESRYCARISDGKHMYCYPHFNDNKGYKKCETAWENKYYLS